MESNFGLVILFAAVVVLLYLWSTINILKEYERGWFSASAAFCPRQRDRD